MARIEDSSSLKGFNDFLHSKTGLVLTALLTLALVERCREVQVTDPNNFPDLESRFRVEKNVDPDGIYRLAVYRADKSPVNWLDTDLVAFERLLNKKCGDMSKFQGREDVNGPVNFRVFRSETPYWSCDYIRE